MPCRLIINADDFGLTQGINRAIAELHQAGVVTSTTLMATGGAFHHAASLSASLPALGVGCHVVLLDGSPVSPPAAIPSLLGSDRKTFRPTLGGFVRDLLLGRICAGEIQLEVEAQLHMLQQSGIRITHLDTHKHIHTFPRVARPVLRAAQRCGIRLIRNPFEPSWSVAASRDRSSSLRLLQLAMVSRLLPSFLRVLPPDRAHATTNGTLGIAATGRMDAQALRSILASAQSHGEDGAVYELVCHPGYLDPDLAGIKTRLRLEREVERLALLLEVTACQELASFRLIHYGDLQK